MKPILFALPGNEAMAAHLRQALGCDVGELELHQFPDGESCPRFHADVNGRDVILVATLDHPDARIMGLYLSASVARELGARSVGLVLPYLAYMRQDARFGPGEGITSLHFARLISSCCDWLVTVDPHLHRHHALSDIYSVDSRVVRAAPAIAAWIALHIKHPILVGPDSESEQWVAEVAGLAGCGYTILEKTRSGDHEVAVTTPDTSGWGGLTPVLVDDIVSTARTMIAACAKLKAGSMPPPVCIAVHPLFAPGADSALQQAGVGRVISCNTVEHATNQIDLSAPIAAAIAELLAR
jgi:ribose-phosphate pyrophosphokinase